ncbi:SagB/ThcOx family dehydrogenase [Halorussus halobius]|uniref:SagB/ThcOx family dehydrogenase n=1 Tax=Halorussus halobius TaxID=1710537 RepID=UPI00109227CF|nr:SagB/ThcOx family dehydrogenase [Halorussus halobius]
MDLSAEAFGNVRDLHVQGAELRGEDLWPEGSYFEQLGRREFEPGDVAEIFHENTKGGPVHDRRQSGSTAKLAEEGLSYVLANIEQDYRGSELVELPEDPGVESADAFDVLDQRRSVRRYADAPVSLSTLSALLRYGCGVSGTVTDAAGNEKALRTYPSGGGLYPVELYPVVLDVDGVESGLYYYSVAEHGLRRLRTGDDGFSEAFEDALVTSDQLNLADAPVVFVMTGAFWRSKSKYGPRGYRYVLQESGHLAQNLLLAAEALGLGGVPAAAFDDRKMNALLDVDGVDEAVVYAVGVGHPADEAVSAP